MAAERQAVPGAVETAARALAMELAGALDGADEMFCLHHKVRAGEGEGNDLAALRVLGADTLAPFVLAGHVFTAQDATLLRASVGAFPAPAPGGDEAPLWAWRDAALARVLTVLGVDTGHWDGLAAPAVFEEAAGQEWPLWSAHLVRLSTLALPPVDGPPRRQTRARRLDLARGMTRALLRRDHLSAARLARWLALDGPRPGEPEPLLETALDHIAQLAVDQPRTLLEVAVARRLLEGTR